MHERHGALQAPEIGAKLGNADSAFTVLAPSNAAFDLIPQEDLDALLALEPALNMVRTLTLFFPTPSLVWPSACICCCPVFPAKGMCIGDPRDTIESTMGHVADDLQACFADPGPPHHPRNHQGC